MLRAYRSIEDARRAFDQFAAKDRRLGRLWDMCRGAARPARDLNLDDDCAPEEVEHDDGWCAEDFFHQEVKPRLRELVGDHRDGEAHELHRREAYEVLYDVLLNGALNRECACCAEQEEEPWYPGDGGSPAHW